MLVLDLELTTPALLLLLCAMTRLRRGTSAADECLTPIDGADRPSEAWKEFETMGDAACIVVFDFEPPKPPLISVLGVVAG